MRKKRRRRVNGFLVFINILLLMIIIALAVFHIIDEKKNTVVGEWEYEIDYSQQIVKAANSWVLNDDEISYSFKPVKLVLSLNEDGTYAVSVDETSYSECSQSAYSYFEKRLNYIIENKLIAEGYEGTDSASVAETLTSQTMGTDMKSYLDEQGVVIIPSADEIKALYVSNGTYNYDKKAQVIEFTDSTSAISKEDVLVTESMLIFLGKVGTNNTSVQNDTGLIVMDDQDTTGDAADVTTSEIENGYPAIFRKKN